MATSVVGELAIWNNTSQSAVTNARPPYVLIAGATGVTAKVKAMAEYVCDGVADQVEINAALAVDDKRPIMLVGRFTTSAAITFTDGIKHDLIGFNEDYAEIQANHTGNALELHSIQLPQEWRITIANLKITKGSGFVPARGISIQNAAFTTFRNVLVSHIDTGTALRGYFCNTNVFENCTFADSAIGVELTGAADQASHLNSFRTCYFRANDIGLKITDRSHGNSWIGCSFDYTSTTDLAVQVIGTNESWGNTWKFCWFEGGNSSGALDLQGASDLIFDRCRFAPNTISWPIVKVSGFGSTDVTLIDPIVSSAACLDTLPSSVAVVKSAGPTTVDVRSFGAIGDGVSDDTVEIQRAIDHLGTAGGVVTGPVGTYLVSKQGQSAGNASFGYCLRVRTDSVHGPVTLDFPRGSIFKLANSQANNIGIFVVDGTLASRRVSPTIIRGITFDGNWSGQTPGNIGSSVWTLYSDNVTVEHCTFQNHLNLGLHILRDSRNVRVAGNFFDATHGIPENTSAALRIETQDILVEGNRFITHATSGQPLIQVGCNADIDLQGRQMRIIGNYFAGGFNGFTVALDGVTHCVVKGNTFRDVCDLSGWALELGTYFNINGTYYDSSHNVVEGNTFINVRQGIQLGGGTGQITSGDATTNYATGAHSNVIRGNIITRDYEDLRTQLDGSGDTFPDRFSPTPGAVAVNMNAGIAESVTDGGITGTATSATTTTLVDSSKAMTTNQYQKFLLVITAGTGKGQVRQIASHTATTFTVSGSWDVTPDTTSTYRITGLSGYNLIESNIVKTTNAAGVGIRSTTYLPTTIRNNCVYGTSAANAFVFTNPNVIATGNKGYSGDPGVASPSTHVVYQDENGGTAAITSAATSVTVTHRLGRTPTADQIMVWPTSSLGSAAKWYLDAASISSTTFTINVDAVPGATVTFGWRVFGSA